MSNRERGKEALSSLEKSLKSRERAERTSPLLIMGLTVVALLVIVGGIIFLVQRNSDGGDNTAADENQAETTAPEEETPEPIALARSEALPATVQCTYEDAGDAAKDISKPHVDDVSTQGTVNVTLHTSAGEIGMDLDRSVSPCTVNAIEHLADEGYYDDTVCHRLTTQGIKVLQCGDPSGQGTGGPGFTLPDEFPTDQAGDNTEPRTYPRGSIAMANTGQPNSGGSQFFLNYGDSPLTPTYTYFGQINDEGLKTLDAIAEKGTEDGMPDGAPAEEVHIERATVA